MWLRGRITFSQRGLELLDRKQGLLRRELADLATRHQSARTAWAQSCAEADRWGLRAAALAGASDVSLAAASVRGEARVDVPWRNTMGVWHPADPVCAPAVLPAVEAAAANPAIAPAAAAYRQALHAAATYAAADRALSVLTEELRSTERHRRAIEHRRLPFLLETLRRLELRLDELEREERVATRWAGHRRERRDGNADGDSGGT